MRAAIPSFTVLLFAFVIEDFPIWVGLGLGLGLGHGMGVHSGLQHILCYAKYTIFSPLTKLTLHKFINENSIQIIYNLFFYINGNV